MESQFYWNVLLLHFCQLGVLYILDTSAKNEVSNQYAPDQLQQSAMPLIAIRVQMEWSTDMRFDDTLDNTMVFRQYRPLKKN